MARSALNVLVGASITPLEKSLKKGVGLVKGFSSQVSKATTIGGGFKASAAKAMTMAGAVAKTGAVAVGTAVGNSLNSGMQAASNFSGKFVKVLGVAGAAAGAALAAGMKVSLSRFAEVESASLRLTTVLRGSGAESAAMTASLQGFAQQLSASTGLAQAEVISGLATVAQAGITDQTVMQNTVKAAANLSVALGSDLAGAISQLTAAQRSPREGYLQLAAAGMAFSDSQIKTIQSLQASGDLLGAQAALAAAVKTNYDGAAEAAGGTLAGGFNTLWTSVTNVAAAIGEGLAPYIKAAVDNMTGWVQTLDLVGVKNVAFEYAAKAVGWVVDGVLALKIAGRSALLGVKVLGLGAVEIFRWMVKAAQEVVRWLELIPGTTKGTAAAIGDFVSGIDGFQSTMIASMEGDAAAIVEGFQRFQVDSQSVQGGYLADVEKGMAKMAATAATSGKAISQNLGEPLKKISSEAAKAQEAATGMIVDLKTQLENFGLEDWQAQANQLQKKGAAPDQVAQVRTLGAALKGKELAQSLATPFETFQRELKKLSDLQAAGGIGGLDYERARGKLVADFQGSLPQNKIQAGGPLMAGSQEARSAIMSYRNASRNADPAIALAKQAEMQHEELKKQTLYLRKLADAKPQLSAAGSGL